MAGVASVRLFGVREVSRGLTGAKAAFVKESSKAMKRVLGGLDRQVKKNIDRQFKKGRGNLRKTVKRVKVGLRGVSGSIRPRFGYARVFEEGETLRPAKSQYLRIPFPGTDRRLGAGKESFIAKSKAGNLIIFRRNAGNPRPVAVLVRSVKMPKRPFLAPALRTRQSSIIDEMGDAYVASVNIRQGRFF